MLKKTPQQRSAAYKKSSTAADERNSDFLEFEYTDEQWAQIERSLFHLKPEEMDLKKARTKLTRAGRDCRKANTSSQKDERRLLTRCWTRVAKLSVDLMNLLDRIDDLEHAPPDPNGVPMDPWLKHKIALKGLNAVAQTQLAAPKDDGDGFPTAGPRIWFQFYVLEFWTILGGKLQFSRHARTGKITGPLARYFSAATQPALGGSLENLPDIVKRHKRMRLALNNWRISQLANHTDSYEEAMTFATSMHMDWVKQGDVQALLKEALRGNGEAL